MTKRLREPARSVPVVWSGDLVVLGGSCTGVFAAVRAARRGLSVALVEQHGFAGGTATAGLVPIWHSFFDTGGQKRIIAGLSQEVVDRLARRDAVVLREPSNTSAYAILNTDELVIELDDLLRQAGVRVFYHARFVAPWPAPEADADAGASVGPALSEDAAADFDPAAAKNPAPTAPRAVVIEDKSGRRALEARYFIDATGDGDLLTRAGFATYTRAALQPPTACAVFSGLGPVLDAASADFNLHRDLFDPRHPEALPPGFVWTSEVPGCPGATMVAGTRVHGVDCSGADALAAAEIEARVQVRRIHDLVRRAVPGGSAVRLARLPAHIGLRESRHAVCEHRLTETEVLSGADFPDAIAQGSYRVDIHSGDGAGLTFRYLDGREHIIDPTHPENGRQGRWLAEGEPTATYYRIPYRSLLPRGADNVWAAGRLVDADAGAYGAVRVMVLANQTGEAAGEAAALAASSNTGAAEVDPEALRAALRSGGSAL